MPILLLSYSSDTLVPMTTFQNEFQRWQHTVVVNCTQCGKEFERFRGPGRRRLYCSRSCRQRAYESRAYHGAQLLPLLPSAAEVGRLRYHAGMVSYGKKEHALVVGALSAGEFRALCGAVVRPLPRGFGHSQNALCKRCDALADKYPPATPLRTFLDGILAADHRRRAS